MTGQCGNWSGAPATFTNGLLRIPPVTLLLFPGDCRVPPTILLGESGAPVVTIPALSIGAGNAYGPLSVHALVRSEPEPRWGHAIPPRRQSPSNDSFPVVFDGSSCHPSCHERYKKWAGASFFATVLPPLTVPSPDASFPRHFSGSIFRPPRIRRHRQQRDVRQP